MGYIDCGTYDRWATWEGGPGGRGVAGTIDVPAGSISYVVDPALRRRGYCAANAGSVGCLRKAGFEPLNPEPDWEGVVYYSRLRNPATPEEPTVPRQPPR